MWFKITKFHFSTEKLQSIERSTVDDLGRCQNNRRITREKKKTFLAKCKEIRQISEDIGGERITVKEFLGAAAATIGRKVGMPNDEEDGEEEDEEDDLGPPLIPEPRQPPVEARYAGPGLERYRLERVILQFDGIQDCPPPEFVAEQLRELEADLAEREATAPHTNLGPQCTYCQTNRATRIVVPCGHWAGCADCCVTILNTPTYFEVVGGIELEDVRLPIRCPYCMSLVGSLMRTF
ncbi:uncharacterized protein LOC120355598 [Nilaparvata lugens]|uniref:uncharacterized protein LOC120355598 n=1 Tax=Nilaparvata lugens TaxID=108931 RepID=UPI00193E7030|nr:uncharacterized protein LOC120355598 [Nilaparvata lugens]